jgi:hypothetical protein
MLWWRTATNQRRQGDIMKRTARLATLASVAGALIAMPLVAASGANAATIGCPGGADGERPGCVEPAPDPGAGTVIGGAGGIGGAVAR